MTSSTNKGSPKTVRVRVAVLIDSDGNYAATGGSFCDDTESMETAQELLTDSVISTPNKHFRWLEIDLAIPSSVAVNLEASEIRETLLSIQVSES